MHGRALACLTFSILIVQSSVASAQLAEERPRPFVATRAPSKKDVDQRASLHQYVLGLLCQREDRLLEALKAFETAARFDPEAAATFKAQVPLLIALDRRAEAVTACQRTLALDAHDFDTWFLAARIQKSLGRFAEAQKALERGLATEAIKDRPEVAQTMWLELGAMHELAEEIEPAIKAFTAAAAILDHPDLLLERGPFERDLIVARAAETHERLGNLYRKAKKLPQAIRAFQEAQQRSGDKAGRFNYNLAQLCQEAGKHAEALDYVDAYLRRQPLGTEAYEMKIALLQKTARADEILPWLEKAAAADRYNISLKGLVARQYALEKRFAQAEKAYLGLAEEAPGEEPYQGLFRVYRDDAGGSLRTLDLLNRAIAQAEQRPITPESARAAGHAKAMIAALRGDAPLAKDLVRVAARQVERPDKLQLDTVQLLAVLADRQEMFAEAERFYRQALRSAPSANEPMLYGGLLRVLWKSRKYDEVLHVCREGLVQAKGTSHVLFHAELAKAHGRLGRHEEALRAADSAVAVAGDNDRFAVRLLRIRVLTQAERYAEAEQNSFELLKTHVLPGETMEIRYILSNIYNVWKKMPQCEEQLEQVLKIDPANATANNDLGYIWADQGKNLEQAEEMIRKALDLDRQQRKRLTNSAAPGNTAADHAAYVDSLGWVLFRRGKLDEARRELERAAALPDGDDAVIWDHLGDVYQQLQMMVQARTAWEKAVQLYEREKRRPHEDRYREVKRKLQSVTAGSQ